MQDTELYQVLLGLTAPWSVARVDLDAAKRRVDVWAQHGPGERWPCPVCARDLGVHDHSDERVWRHLDSCQFETYLHARPPRVRCPEHGVRQAKLPWAEERARFTALFERFAIDVLREMDVAGAMRVLRVSWDEAWHIVERAVKRGQAFKQRVPSSFIGVDETASARGHRYVTVVCDLERGTVEHVAEGHRWDSFASYYEALSDDEVKAIKAVAMDMWDPYIKATREHLPDWENKIVFDRFHVMKNLNLAVDNVRRRESSALRNAGDDRLKGTRYMWLYAEESRPARYDEAFEELQNTNLKTARAWAIKETLRQLWSYRQPHAAREFWKRWYGWATRSQLEPVVKAAKTIKRHIRNVLTYFNHRITNAMAEGLNAKIQRIKRAANGYRNVEHFKTAIYFHCGGLQLYPGTHAKP